MIVLTLATGYVAEHGSSGVQQLTLYEMHFSLGVVALFLLILLLAVRAAEHGSDAERPLFQRWAARVVHVGLYGAMIAALASGLINFLFLGPVRIFGLIHMPRLFDPETQEPLRALSWYVHYYSYWTLLGLILVHVAAAFHHHFIRRDRVLLDFLPW